MATLLIPAMFNLTAAAGGFWFYAATAAGMYIDSTFTFPTLFPIDAQYGPQIEGQPMGRWSEGTPVPRVFGASGRCPGQVIWQSPIKEIKDEQSGGGKGGGGGSYITYKYYCNVGVAFCKGPISRVKKVLADGKTIWNIAPDIDYTTTQITGSAQIVYVSDGSYGGGGYTAFYDVTLLSSGSGSPDLSLIKSGKILEISAPGGSGSFEVESSDANIVAGTTTCKVRVGSQAGVSAGGGTHPWSSWSGGTTVLHQDLPTHSGKQLDAIRFHNGSDLQEPDSMLETYKGFNQAPAFRGIAYCIVENLALFDFGNRIPSFSAIIEDDEDRRLADALAMILDEGDLDPGEYDLSGIEDKVCEGYVIAGPQETMKSLQPLLVQNDILVQQVDSSLRFYHRKDARRVDIKVEHLAAGGSKAAPIAITETPVSQLPDEINIDYLDINNDYNKGSQRQRRNNNVSSREQGISLPIVMETVEARRIASRMLWSEWNNRLRVTFSVPALEYVDKLLEGDVARFTALGEDWELLVNKIDRGADLMMHCEGTVEDKSMLAGYSAGEEVNLLMSAGTEDGSYTGANPSIHSPSALMLHFGCRPLQEAHMRTPGFYFGCCSADARFNFNGAVLMESLDGVTYERVQVVTGGSYVGFTSHYTAKAASLGQWDNINEITVEFHSGTPQSVTEAEVLNGSNRAAFGREIIGFQTATHVSGTIYKLSKLIRGLRGTEAFIGDLDSAATASVPVVLLNQPFVHFHEVPSGAVGSTRYYKLIANGGMEETAVAYRIELSAVNVLPMAPVNVERTLDASNNSSITWVSRSRSLNAILGTQGRPTGEPKEEYKVEVLSVDASTTLNAQTATEVSSSTYTAAQATTDGLTPGAALKVQISQFSEFHKFGTTTQVHTL
tara:strand:- start:670 stop:3351 length:2682 start_codon:yes stop_codon:yes gene_type:complete